MNIVKRKNEGKYTSYYTITLYIRRERNDLRTCDLSHVQTLCFVHVKSKSRPNNIKSRVEE